MMRTLVVAAAAAALAAPAGAQEQAPQHAKVELSAGYSHLKADEIGRNGWSAGLAWNAALGGKLGAVVDVAGHYASEEGGENLSDYAFMGGLRFALHRRGFTPFVHALAGVCREAATLHVFGVSISETATDVAWAVGGGVNVRLSEHWALSARGDYFSVSAESGSSGNPRFGAGIAYRIGGH
jgi:opacity protein-like surface antigen